MAELLSELVPLLLIMVHTSQVMRVNDNGHFTELFLSYLRPHPLVISMDSPRGKMPIGAFIASLD